MDRKRTFYKVTASQKNTPTIRQVFMKWGYFEFKKSYVKSASTIINKKCDKIRA